MIGYKYVYRHGHPLAYSDGRVAEHRVHLYDKIGAGPHKCYWCGVQVIWSKGSRTAKGSLVVDHLDQNHHNNHPDNLVASCHPCNCGREHPQSILDGELSITWPDGSRHRAVKRTCKKCKKDFLHLEADHRSNRGQFCSRSCARSWPRRSVD